MKAKKVKKLLVDILDNTDLCFLCEHYGQKLPECHCLLNSECAKHIIELFKEKEKNNE